MHAQHQSQTDQTNNTIAEPKTNHTTTQRKNYQPHKTKQGQQPTIQAKQRPVAANYTPHKSVHAPVQRKSTQAKPPTIHTVKKGDTYSALAQKYGVTVEQLRAWNGFADEAIPIGAQLLVSDPMKMTDEELQDYINKFDLNKYLGQMGVPSVGDDSTSKKHPRNPDPSVVGGYTQLGQVPRDFRGKQFYNHEGKLVPFQDFIVKSFNSKNLRSAGGIGSGMVGMNDYLKRRKYIAKVGKAAQEYLKRFDAELTSKGKWDIMKQANESRNINRPLARQGLSFGGKNLSKALDQPRGLMYLLSKYQQNENSGEDKKRQPQSYTSKTLGDLVSRGFKYDKKADNYYKTVKIKNKDGKRQEVTTRTIKLPEYDENGKDTGNFIYYACDPDENGEHMYVGFLTRSSNPSPFMSTMRMS